MAFPDYGSPSPTKPNQGKVPKGGLGQLMQSILGKGGPQGAGAPAGTPGAPPPMPGPGMPQPMGVPPVPGMPGPGGPMQGAGMQPGISPEEYQAILEQIKGELMKDIAGQSGQQDQVFGASAGLGKYRPMGVQAMRPMGNPNFPQLPPQPMGTPQPPMQGMPQPPQDAAFPPGMNPAGLDQWRRTGNPNPGMGRPVPPRPRF